MMFKKQKVRISPFLRKRLLIRTQDAKKEAELPQLSQVYPKNEGQDFSVLVLNASHKMATEITKALKNEIEKCRITYAPSIALTKLLLERRKVDLIISSSFLPDGSVSMLKSILSECMTPPDLLVVGTETNLYLAKRDSNASYNAQSLNMKLAGYSSIAEVDEETFKALGADIRNDLNNPLQEIVAMVFVAQTSPEMAPQTEQALVAIDKAAHNMSLYVNELEERIRKAVSNQS